MSPMILGEYLRKSRSDNRDEPVETTLRRHREILESYAANQGYIIKKVYLEVVSGESIVARPQMMQLLEDVEAGEFDAVLCIDIDRLGRGGMKDQGIIMETFQFSDTKILTPDKLYDLSNDLDEELTEFKAFFARREYKIIRKRMQRGLDAMTSQGAYLSNAPFGYKKVKTENLPTLEIVADEAQLVRLIYDMYVNQRIGTHTIAETLNSFGVSPRRNTDWNRNTVRGILKNPVYTGKVCWNKVTRKRTLHGEVVAHYHPPQEWSIYDGLHQAIITQQLFDQAQEIRTRHHLPAYHNGECRSQLAGLILCKNCGKMMQLQVCRGRWRYLRCMQKGCCGSGNYDDVEASVLECLCDRWMCLPLDSQTEHDISAVSALLSAQQREINACRAQRNRIMGLLEQGVYTVEDYRQRTASLSDHLNKTMLRHAALSAQREQILNTSDRLLADNPKSVLDFYVSSEISVKNSLIKAAIDSMTYSKESGRDQPFYLNITRRTF